MSRRPHSGPRVARACVREVCTVSFNPRRRLPKAILERGVEPHIESTHPLRRANVTVGIAWAKLGAKGHVLVDLASSKDAGGQLLHAGLDATRDVVDLAGRRCTLGQADRCIYDVSHEDEVAGHVGGAPHVKDGPGLMSLPDQIEDRLLALARSVDREEAQRDAGLAVHTAV